MAGDDSKKVPTPKVSANVSVDPNPAYPSSKTGGVIPMGLETRFSHERARLSPDYTETWRKWRVQFLKDQELHPSEPRHVPQLVRETTNPIRRFYLIPFNWFEQNVLVKMMNPGKARVTRMLISRSLMSYAVALFVFYQYKYNSATWEKRGGIGVWHTKPRVYPGDHRYPLPDQRTTKQDFYDLGFSQRKALRFEQ